MVADERRWVASSPPAPPLDELGLFAAVNDEGVSVVALGVDEPVDDDAEEPVDDAEATGPDPRPAADESPEPGGGGADDGAGAEPEGAGEPVAAAAESRL